MERKTLTPLETTKKPNFLLRRFGALALTGIAVASSIGLIKRAESIASSQNPPEIPTLVQFRADPSLAKTNHIETVQHGQTASGTSERTMPGIDPRAGGDALLAADARNDVSEGDAYNGLKQGEQIVAPGPDNSNNSQN